jgi:hypothetical protein
MPIVEIYRFRAIQPAAAHAHAVDLPPDAQTYDGILFVRQDAAGRDDEAMRRGFAHCGVEQPDVFANATLDPAVLARPANRDWAPLYERALRDGASVVQYVTPQAPWQGR